MQLGLVSKVSDRECKMQVIWFRTCSNDITISSYIASHYHSSTPPGEQGEADHCCDQKPRHLLLVLLSPLLLALQHLSLCDNLNNFSLTPISTASCYLGHCWNLFWNCIKAFLGRGPWSLWRMEKNLNPFDQFFTLYLFIGSVGNRICRRSRGFSLWPVFLKTWSRKCPFQSQNDHYVHHNDPNFRQNVDENQPDNSIGDPEIFDIL